MLYWKAGVLNNQHYLRKHLSQTLLQACHFLSEVFRMLAGAIQKENASCLKHLTCDCTFGVSPQVLLKASAFNFRGRLDVIFLNVLSRVLNLFNSSLNVYVC